MLLMLVTGECCPCALFVVFCLLLQVAPGCTCTRTLRVDNPTHLPLPFQWHLTQLPISPTAAKQAAQELAIASRCIAAASISCDEVAGHNSETSQLESNLQDDKDLSQMFCVVPCSGVIQAGEVLEFTVKFLPQFTGQHAALAELLVGRSGDDFMRIINTADAPSGSSGPFSAKGAAADLSVSSAGSTAAHCGMQLDQPALQGSMDLSLEAWQTMLHLGFEGLGVPVTVRAEPASGLLLPGHLTVCESEQQLVTLHNVSAAPLRFLILPEATGASSYCGAPGIGSVESTGDASGCAGRVGDTPADSTAGDSNVAAAVASVQIWPRTGTIPPESSLQLTVNFTAITPGHHTQHFICHVAHGQPLPLEARVVVKEASVAPSVSLLDYGILQVGSSSSRQLQLINTSSSCSSFWKVEALNAQVCYNPPACQTGRDESTAGKWRPEYLMSLTEPTAA
jgi:hypothetical protein